MTEQELEELLKQAEEDARKFNVLQPLEDRIAKARAVTDLSDEELLALQAKAEADAAGLEPVQPVQGPNLPTEEIKRSILLPVGINNKTGEKELALPTAITEPVDAWKRFVDSARGQDFSEGVPETTDQQISDAFTVGGTISMPSLLGRGMPNDVFINPLPTTPVPKNVKLQMKTVKAPQPPTVRKVVEVNKNAPEDLKTLETAKDQYKAYILDEKTALSDIAERAGIPNLKDVKSLIDQDTQISGLMRVNESLKTGKLRSIGGEFNVEVSPEQLFAKYKALPPGMQQDADQYMKLRDLTDDMNLRIAKNIDVAESQRILTDAQQSIAQIEQRTPVVHELSKDYRAITEAVRGFMGSGKNAMLDQKALEALGKERANYVPIDIHGIDPTDPLMSRIVDAQRLVSKGELDDWFLQARDIKNITNIEGRTDAFETLLGYTRNALKAKLENDVRGQYADGISNSTFGKETMRKLKDDEAGKYSGRTVDIYENGKKVKYIASQLQADLLRFDPHIAQFPAFYATKRMFEHGTTGALGMTFAPVTLIRDMLAGNALAPKGVGKPGIFRTLAAVPEAVVDKAALGASILLKGSFRDLPFLPAGSKTQLSNALAARYARSYTALANEVGGYDASLMKSTIEAKRGLIGEVKRSLEDVADKVPGANFLGRSARVMWDGWEGLFGAISDAPRAAAFKQSIKKGVDPSTAAVEARKLTGDTTRSGKVYKPDGTRIDADAVDKSWQVGAKSVGAAAQFAREAIPYVNPTLQGMRRLGNRMIEDPVGVNLNAWKYVGLPAIAAYGWNEMLGKEYNDYAHRNRADRDQAMTIYVGVPGMPPEQGIEIPLPHELMPYNIFNTALYNLGRGDEDVGKSMMHMAGTILENGSMIGYPVGFSQAFTAAGYRPPESIMTPWDDVYAIREDNAGFFPQNVEMLLRQTVGGVSDLALSSAAAAYEGGPEAFAKEFAYNWTKKVPILKNIAGTKTATSAFTPQSNEKFRKQDALDQFLDVWDEHFNPAKNGRLYANNLPKRADGNSEEDVSTFKLGPSRYTITTPVPTNPVFKQFGEIVKQYIGTNDEGMTALRSRQTNIGKQIDLLKKYTAGNSSAFKEYQKVIIGAEDRYIEKITELENSKDTLPSKEYKKALAGIELNYGEPAKAERLLKKLDIDLGKRNDVNKLINYLEQERTGLVDEQLVIIKKLEDYMTQQLHENKMLPPNTRFDVEKHLTPLVPKDFRTSSVE